MCVWVPSYLMIRISASMLLWTQVDLIVGSYKNSSCEEGANGMDSALGLGWDVEVSTAEQETSMNIVRIGFDLAKYVFHLHGVDERGKVVLRKITLPGVALFFANLPRCVVGMEASNGAHYWARLYPSLVTTCG